MIYIGFPSCIVFMDYANNSLRTYVCRLDNIMNRACAHFSSYVPVSEFRDTSSCHVSSNEGINEKGRVLIRVGK